MNKLWQKWLSGDGRREEEAALAKAAQDDPFVADAMAGYESMPEADHLAAHERLRQRLAARSDNGRAVAPPARYYQAAAAVAMLLLAGSAFWYANRPGDSMAVVMDAPQPPAETIAAPSEKMSPAEPMEPATRPTPATAPMQPTRPRPRPAADELIALPASPLPPAAPAAEQSKAMAADDEPAPATGRSEAQPDIAEGSSGRGAPPDQAEAIVAAKERAVTAPPPTSAPPAALKKEARRSKAQAESSPPPPLSPILSVLPQGAAAPVGGGEALAQYLATQIRRPPTVQRGEISGAVWVSFVVSPSGRLSDFLVTKHLCDPCDVEAIRLLREGPAWELSGSEAAKVTCEVVFE